MYSCSVHTQVPHAGVALLKVKHLLGVKLVAGASAAAACKVYAGNASGQLLGSLKAATGLTDDLFPAWPIPVDAGNIPGQLWLVVTGTDAEALIYYSPHAVTY